MKLLFHNNLHFLSLLVDFDDILYFFSRPYFDKDLLAASAGYVRDSLVMASVDQNSEFEHLERILLDAVCTEPIEPLDEDVPVEKSTSKYEKYQKEPYTPAPHMTRSDEE